jgi:acyl-CoA thioester hydrolase
MEPVAVDPIVHTNCWPVRHYELDRNGHVNNAVYLNYAEQLTIEHAEAAGFGAEWSAGKGGTWVVHRSVLTYQSPAVYGDLLELTVRVELVRGTRGIRRTTIKRAHDGRPVAEVLTEWVWVRTGDGRPTRVPDELAEVAREATAETLRRNPGYLADLRRASATAPSSRS